tara:strand:+ start:1619 stop:2392 length:774 start_codon:yes stop_codon:yes gene_type:complete
MKKNKILACLLASFLLSPIALAHEEQSYDEYVDYINYNNSEVLMLDVMNQVIREVGGMYRIEQLADTGMDKPSFVLGSLYLEGRTHKKDVDRAIEILTKGAENGPYSALVLGLHYLDKNGDHKYDFTTRSTGADYIYESAISGLQEAQFVAAELLIKGNLLPQDRDMAMLFLHSAASSGYQPAVSMLMEMHELHTEFKEDYDRVHRRAMEGHLPSVIRLAEYYDHGWKVQQDKVKARRLLEYAAKKGSETAKQKLAN